MYPHWNQGGDPDQVGARDMSWLSCCQWCDLGLLAAVQPAGSGLWGDPGICWTGVEKGGWTCSQVNLGVGHQCYCAHAGLGVFNADHVRDLCLPAFEGSPLPAGSGESSSSRKVEGTSGAVAQKFQLGPTLPVVPARLVRRVQRGDYVDMVELTEENLELELRRSIESDDGKPISLNKLKPVPDVLTSARSFCLYAGIVVSAHPSKARDLLAYLATLLAGTEKGDWWRAYDSRFRQQLPSLKSAEFGRLDQALFTRTIFAAGGAQRNSAAPHVESMNQPAPKRCRTAACFAWNDGRNACHLPDIFPTSAQGVAGSIGSPPAHRLGRARQCLWAAPDWKTELNLYW